MTPRALARGIGEGSLVAGFLLLTAMPLVDFLGRPLAGFHIPGSATYTQQLTFFLTFIGGLAATLTGKHLTLSTASLLPGVRVRRDAEFFSSCVAASVTAILTYASICVVIAERMQGRNLTLGLPVWVSESVMPLGLGLISLTYILKSSNWLPARLGAAAIAGASFLLGIIHPGDLTTGPCAQYSWPRHCWGSPCVRRNVRIGAALFLGGRDTGYGCHRRRLQACRLSNPSRHTAADRNGLCHGGDKRSTATREFFSGAAGVHSRGSRGARCRSLCAFHCAYRRLGCYDHSSGGLVYPILLEGGYSESFSLGLVTAAGSLGLLFPPCLAVVLYSVVSNTPADQLFIAGLVPGTLLLTLVAIYGISVSLKAGIERQPFKWRELLAAARCAKWDLSIPVAMILLFGTGLASMLETSAFAFAYTIVIACFIHRDLHPLDRLPATLVNAAALVGAVLMLLSCAMGLTGYLVDAQIPDRLLEVVREQIHSPLLFLLALNVVLLVAGSVLEIFSAIIVLTPLVVPLGVAFGIHPVHLGIIFLANLELGFLFPPVGLNLLLSSSRFGKPMTALYCNVIPFLLILGLGVLLITYVPALSIGVLRLLGRI